MDFGSALGALIVAFLITVLELTEVVAIVYALGASSADMRPGIHGALSGIATVGMIALVTGVAIAHFLSVVTFYFLVVSSIMLWGFGFFLLRSTVKTYFKEAKKRMSGDTSGKSSGEDLSSKALFSGGFSVAGVETLEAVIVLLALTAGGYGVEALIGFAAAAALLATLGYLLHENIRKVKVPPMKWVGTSLLFTFALFWGLEALASKGLFSWPSLGPLPSDLLLIPIFVVILLVVKVVVGQRVAKKVEAVRLGA